jgi:hypothetical protein
MNAQTELADFFALLDEAHRDRVAREAAYRAWLDEALPAMADELTGTLPPEMRAAGIRFEWGEGE